MKANIAETVVKFLEDERLSLGYPKRTATERDQFIHNLEQLAAWYLKAPKRDEAGAVTLGALLIAVGCSLLLWGLFGYLVVRALG